MTKTKSFERKFKAFFPRKVKFALARIICNKYIGKLIKFLNFKKTILGGYFNFRLVSDIQAAKIFFGIWESAEIRFCKRFINNNTIIELGSSVGVTLGLLSKFNSDCEVVCVEANPLNYEILLKLSKEIPKNNNRYHFHNNAIYYKSDQVEFYITSTTGSSIFNNNSSKKISLRAITLSEIINIHCINKPYTLITDIEGSEADIFFNDSLALELCFQIICELEDIPNFSIEQQLNRLNQLGFKVIEKYGNVFYLEKSKT